jgi:molybdopterin-containing oxidoreductase family membrane subunit
MFAISIVVNIGMWFERFVIIVTSLHRDFLPSSWGYFKPSLVDITTFAGTFGLFFTLFLLFIRFLPMVAISEVKGIMPAADPHAHADGTEREETRHAHA